MKATPDRIIFGCHNLTGGSSYWRSKRIVDAAFELGIRRFDVAPSYGLGTAEATLARALGRRRMHSDVKITTKFGILPPRLGQLKALIREPYRLARGLVHRDRRLQPSSRGQNMRRSGNAATPEFPFKATQAALHSLMSLGIDRLDGFLIHERLSEGRCQHLLSELLELKRLDLIDHYGVSGELNNVSDMAAVIGTPDIVQIAISEAGAAPPGKELRVFNLVRALQEHYQQPEHRGDAEKLMSETTMALDLAMMVQKFLAENPNARVLFNTLSPQRLEMFVKALCV